MLANCFTALVHAVGIMQTHAISVDGKDGTIPHQEQTTANIFTPAHVDELAVFCRELALHSSDASRMPTLLARAASLPLFNPLTQTVVTYAYEQYLGAYVFYMEALQAQLTACLVALAPAEAQPASGANALTHSHHHQQQQQRSTKSPTETAIQALKIASVAVVIRDAFCAHRTQSADHSATAPQALFFVNNYANFNLHDAAGVWHDGSLLDRQLIYISCDLVGKAVALISRCCGWFGRCSESLRTFVKTLTGLSIEFRCRNAAGDASVLSLVEDSVAIQLSVGVADLAPTYDFGHASEDSKLSLCLLKLLKAQRHALQVVQSTLNAYCAWAHVWMTPKSVPVNALRLCYPHKNTTRQDTIRFQMSPWLSHLSLVDVLVWCTNLWSRVQPFVRATGGVVESSVDTSLVMLSLVEIGLVQFTPLAQASGRYRKQQHRPLLTSRKLVNWVYERLRDLRTAPVPTSSYQRAVVFATVAFALYMKLVASMDVRFVFNQLRKARLVDALFDYDLMLPYAPQVPKSMLSMDAVYNEHRSTRASKRKRDVDDASASDAPTTFHALEEAELMEASTLLLNFAQQALYVAPATKRVKTM